MNIEDVTADRDETELKYLKDSNLRSVEANIIRTVADKGQHVYLVLDKTIFHPKEEVNPQTGEPSIPFRSPSP